MKEHQEDFNRTIFLWGFVVSAFLVALMGWGWWMSRTPPPPPEVGEWTETEPVGPTVSFTFDEQPRFYQGVEHRMVSDSSANTGCSMYADGGFAMYVDGEQVWP